MVYRWHQIQKLISSSTLQLRATEFLVVGEFDTLPWISFGAHWDGAFVPYIELERIGPRFEGYFDIYNFTGGHGMGEGLEFGENIYCEPFVQPSSAQFK
jgi:hypothetical protein